MTERKITALKVQKRNPNRVNVYLDGEFAFGAARITAAWLEIGQVLDDAQIARLQEQDTQEVAYIKALRLLGHRPRTQREIVSRLEKNGFEDPVIEAVLARLKASGLISDEEFARAWVEDRALFHPRSRRAMAFELRQKGVAEQTIEQALDGHVDESELAYQAAARRVKRWQGLTWPEFRQKASAYLARLGFSYEISVPQVSRLWKESRIPEGEHLTNEYEKMSEE